MTEESWRCGRVRRPAGPEVRATFDGGQLAGAADFQKRLPSMAPGALYGGTTRQPDRLLAARGPWRIETVEIVGFQGHGRERRAWIFRARAIADGRLYERNAEDYFEIGAGAARRAVKSFNNALGLSFGGAGDYRADWPDLVWRAFGARGIAAGA